MTAKPVWFQVNFDNAQAKKAEAAWRKAQEAANEARKTMEEVMRPLAQASAPEGTEPIFGYKFGKISCAFVTEDQKRSKGSGKSLTL